MALRALSRITVKEAPVSRASQTVRMSWYSMAQGKTRRDAPGLNGNSVIALLPSLSSAFPRCKSHKSDDSGEFCPSIHPGRLGWGCEPEASLLWDVPAYQSHRPQTEATHQDIAFLSPGCRFRPFSHLRGQKDKRKRRRLSTFPSLPPFVSSLRPSCSSFRALLFRHCEPSAATPVASRRRSEPVDK